MKKLMIAAPALSGIFWGTCGIFVRTLSEMGMNSITILFTRVLLSVFFLFICIFIYDRSLLKIRFRDLPIFAGAGLIGTLGLNICYNESINQLTLSLAAVLLGLSPVFVLLLAAVLFHEKITKRKFGCMIMAVSGCVLVSGVLEEASQLQWSAKGILIGVLSGLFYALYSIFSKLALERGYHAFTIIFYSFLLICVILAPVSDWSCITGILAASPLRNGLFMILHSLFASALPYILYTLSFNYMDAGKAAILATTEPVAAMVFGVFIYNEIPTLLCVTGLALTTAALILLSLPEKIKADS